jgi:hypothetical protein
MFEDNVTFKNSLQILRSTSTYLSIYDSAVILLDLGRFFSFVNILHRRLDALDEWSARRKAATYIRNNTNTE